MPNWVTIKPASDNFSPSDSNVGGNWVTVKPANVIPETPKEPTWTEKIGAFIGNAVRNPRETINQAGEFIGGSVIAKQNLKTLQPEANARVRSEIEKNKALLDRWEQKKKENPAKTDFYNAQIDSLNKRNQEILSTIGQEWGDLNFKQKSGYNIGAAVDIAGIIAPIQGLIKNAGKLAVSTAIKRYGAGTFGEIFREGSRVIGQQGIEEILKKGGGKIGAEATDTIIREGMESLGKQGLLKGDKLLSKEGIRNLATNPFVTEGAAYGGAQGLSGGMQQNQEGLDLLKSTAEGTAYGVGGGVALHTAGKIITGATRGIVDSVSSKIAGKEATQEARAAIEAAEEMLGHKLGRTEKKQITKAVFKGATKDDITKNIINEADKAGVELDTTGIVKSTEPTVHKPENIIDDIMDIPAQERISREIASTEDPTVISEKLKGLVPEKDIPVVSEQLKNIDNPDDISRIIDGFNPEAIKDELSLRIATTDNPKKIASLLKGQVPDDDIPALSQMMKGVEDEVTVKKMIDNANIPKPKAEVPKEVQPKMIERDMTEQEIATALAKKELSRYKETDSRFQANRKAVGMAYSSLKKRLEGNATAKEVKNTRKYLESNYVGKEVKVDGRKGVVKKNAFGRPGVDFGDGKIEYFDAEKVKSKKVSDKEVYAKIIDDARKELDGKKSIYSISTKISEPEKVIVAPDKIKEKTTVEPDKQQKIVEKPVASVKSEAVSNPVKEKQKTEQKKEEPIVTSTVLTKSKLSKTTLRDAIRSGMEVDQSDIPVLGTMNLDDQSDRFMKLISEHDGDFVEKVMTKEIDSPDQKLLPGSIYSGLKKIAIENKDYAEVDRLRRMKSILGLARRSGQESKAFDARLKFDPDKMMDEMVDLKKEIATKSGIDPDKVVKETMKEMDDFIEKSVSTDGDLSKEINNVMCK